MTISSPAHSLPRHEARPSAPKSRGSFLSVLILANAAAVVFITFAVILTRDLDGAIGVFPDWFHPFLLAMLTARLVSFAAIWSFRRWGMYLYILLGCLEVVMGLFVFRLFVYNWVFSLPVRVGIAPAFLLLLAVWYLALRTRWRAFT